MAVIDATGTTKLSGIHPGQGERVLTSMVEFQSLIIELYIEAFAYESGWHRIGCQRDWLRWLIRLTT